MLAINSMMKSLADTASTEFCMAFLNPSLLASLSRSIGKGLPARAPAPSGDCSHLFSASLSLSRSLSSIS